MRFENWEPAPDEPGAFGMRAAADNTDTAVPVPDAAAAAADAAALGLSGTGGMPGPNPDFLNEGGNSDRPF